MSPKSKRKFNKNAGQRRNPPSTAARSQFATPKTETRPQGITSSRPVESRSSPAATAAAAAASQANVPRELKRIGILAGILAVALIILAIILS